MEGNRHDSPRSEYEDVEGAVRPNTPPEIYDDVVVAGQHISGEFRSDGYVNAMAVMEDYVYTDARSMTEHNRDTLLKAASKQPEENEDLASLEQSARSLDLASSTSKDTSLFPIQASDATKVYENNSFVNYNDQQMTSDSLQSVSFPADTKTLLLRENHLETIPETVTSLYELTHLDVSRQTPNSQPTYERVLSPLRKLPPTIGRLANLQELILDSNNIQALPGETAQLTALKVLWLNTNKLREFPRVCFHLKRLVDLRLSCNYIVEIPQDIGQEMSQLQVMLV